MARWASGVGRLPCDECRAAHQPSRWDTEEDRRRKGDGPPCETCRPELMPGNDEAWAIYQRCQGQLVMSMEGGVDISIPAVLALMELEEVADKRDCLARVQTLAWGVLGEQRKANSRRAQGAKEAG